jgi:hypothetical protein
MKQVCYSNKLTATFSLLQKPVFVFLTVKSMMTRMETLKPKNENRNHFSPSNLGSPFLSP